MANQLGKLLTNFDVQRIFKQTRGDSVCSCVVFLDLFLL